MADETFDALTKVRKRADGEGYEAEFSISSATRRREGEGLEALHKRLANRLVEHIMTVLLDSYPHLFTELYKKGYKDACELMRKALEEDGPERNSEAVEGDISIKPSKETDDE